MFCSKHLNKSQHLSIDEVKKLKHLWVTASVSILNSTIRMIPEFCRRPRGCLRAERARGWSLSCPTLPSPLSTEIKRKRTLKNWTWRHRSLWRHISLHTYCIALKWVVIGFALVATVLFIVSIVFLPHYYLHKKAELALECVQLY